MKTAAANALDDFEKRTDAYYFYMVYHFMQFCIKAEPAALLSFTVKVDGSDYNIEDVAGIRRPNEYTFEIIPNELEDVLPITKALALQHPEFHQEQKEVEDPLRWDEITSMEDKGKTKKAIHIYCVMPEVNEDRHDVGMDYVSLLYTETVAKLDALLAAFIARTAKRLARLLTPEEMDEFKDQLQKKYDTTKKMCDDARAKKEKEIEDAYHEYLEKEGEAQQAETEKEQARGEHAGMSMQMEYNEEEEDDPFE